MSLEYEIEVYATCDECGKVVDKTNCQILCKQCQTTGAKGNLHKPYCSPVLFGGKYTCLNTNQDYKWDGDLPTFCPMCGEPIRR